MDTKTKIKEYLDRSPYSEQGIADMIGLGQSTFSAVKNGNFHRKPDATEDKMEAWLQKFGYPLEDLSRQLKVHSTERYTDVPVGLVLMRMRMHSTRSKFMNGITDEEIKTGMRKPTKRAASLQS